MSAIRGTADEPDNRWLSSAYDPEPTYESGVATKIRILATARELT